MSNDNSVMPILVMCESEADARTVLQLHAELSSPTLEHDWARTQAILNNSKVIEGILRHINPIYAMSSGPQSAIFAVKWSVSNFELQSIATNTYIQIHLHHVSVGTFGRGLHL